MAAKAHDNKPKKAWLKSPYLIGLSLSLVASFYFFLWPIATDNYISWNPGKLHSAHQILNQNCQACHQNNFKTVPDSACEQCHNMQNHGSSQEAGSIRDLSAHTKVSTNQSCVDCHFEHEGPHGLIQSDDRSCLDCHKDLNKQKSDTHFKNIADFKDHPRFAVSSFDSNNTLTRAEIGKDAKDNNSLKLNHALHLKDGLRGPNGTVQMTCADCHDFSDKSSGSSVKITFEKNCRSCHQLTFDDALADNVVPHGNESLVLPHLILSYSKLANLDPVKVTQQLELIRSVPGKAIKQLNQDPQFVKILAQARQAEELLFTKTSCNLCHQVTEDPTNASRNNLNRDNLEGRFKITKPEIPQPWLIHANFPHSSHEIENCESCHSDVRESKNTADILLPQIDNCQQCHIADSSEMSKHSSWQVKTNCISCHNYHDQLPLEQSHKEKLAPLISEILTSTAKGS